MTNSTRSVSRFAHLYLGNAETDPVPVYRDLSPKGVQLPDGTYVAWPDDAVFGVQFVCNGTPSYEFFDNDGWPLSLTQQHRGLSPLLKRELHVHPWNWRAWDASDWKSAELYPETFRRGRAMSALVRSFLPACPAPIPSP